MDSKGKLVVKLGVVCVRLEHLRGRVLGITKVDNLVQQLVD
jgi:hypothetical protein